EMHGNNLAIIYKDNGIGIPENDIKYIFDRFYRGDKSRKRESGSGLGLSISKWIAEAHQGIIEVKSKPLEGSLFTIKLPV
ncbi:MAG: HAMP domain-containing sensor histidine kinase, partial [Deltaproteobacteria bacterium]